MDYETAKKNARSLPDFELHRQVDLRNEIGHDLKTAWDEARKKGLKIN